MTVADPTIIDRRGLVPAWTPEDEVTFRQRVQHTDRLRHADLVELSVRDYGPGMPTTTLAITLELGIARRPRATCPWCRKRRILYVIAGSGNAFGASEPRCARDWGIR